MYVKEYKTIIALKAEDEIAINTARASAVNKKLNPIESGMESDTAFR
jgi:hypothetical protein